MTDRRPKRKPRGSPASSGGQFTHGIRDDSGRVIVPDPLAEQNSGQALAHNERHFSFDGPVDYGKAHGLFQQLRRRELHVVMAEDLSGGVEHQGDISVHAFSTQSEAHACMDSLHSDATGEWECLYGPPPIDPTFHRTREEAVEQAREIISMEAQLRHPSERVARDFRVGKTPGGQWRVWEHVHSGSSLS